MNPTLNKIAATLFSLLASGLLAAGCGAGAAPVPVAPGLLNVPPKWGCEAKRGDDECMRCMRSSCCDVASICFDDEDCALELACSLRQRSVCPGASPRGTRKTLDVLSCQQTHCESCPKIKGDLKP
jgi:hypothetical protein